METSRAGLAKALPVGRTGAISGSAPAAAHVDSASKGSAGEERRRSQRVLLRIHAKVHVALDGKATTFDATTLSVKSHGVLIAIEQNLPIETRLVFEHNGTRERMSCRVVRPS
jgi:hypothetical protein